MVIRIFLEMFIFASRHSLAEFFISLIAKNEKNLQPNVRNNKDKDRISKRLN